jgi:tRNA threonylcarbamoyladenosine biosynthesis protein TsaB
MQQENYTAKEARMNILGIDTTGNTLSVAVSENENLLSEIYINIGKKHSTTLMPTVDAALKAAERTIQEIDVFAVAAGPGSFTGIRIGVAACEALAHAGYKQVAAVSTLDALIANAGETGNIVCAVMDARRGEVYTAAKLGKTIVVEECAIPLKELLRQRLPDEKVTFVGDAAWKFQDEIIKERPNSVFLPEQFLMQHASSVCRIAWEQACEGKLLSYDGLRPHYLRESQAERLKKSGR